MAIAPANTGATGYLFPVLAPLACGAAAVLLENWSPAGGLDLLESEHASHAAAIPTQLVKMLQEEGVGRRDFSSVRVITSAGAPLTPDTAEQTEDTFGCAVTTVYGSTDGGVITVTRTAEDAFLIVTGTAFGTHDLSWIRKHAPRDGSVRVADVTGQYASFALWGPRSRDILAGLRVNRDRMRAPAKRSR